MSLPSRSGKTCTVARSSSTASPSTSIVPTARLSAACRSARCCTEKRRFRYRAASSNRSAAAASRIFSSSLRRIGVVSPDRNSITWSMIAR